MSKKERGSKVKLGGAKGSRRWQIRPGQEDKMPDRYNDPMPPVNRQERRIAAARQRQSLRREQ